MFQKILVSGFFRQSSIRLTTKQIHFPKIVKIGSIIVNGHAREKPGLTAGFSRTGMGGLRLFTVTPSLSARTGPFSGPIQAFSAFFCLHRSMSWTYTSTLILHGLFEKSISVRIPKQNPGNLPRLSGVALCRRCRMYQAKRSSPVQTPPGVWDFH